jgi:hypothetical protein
LLGLEEEDRRAVYYVALLRYAGCTAESHLDAALFGDEIAVRANRDAPLGVAHDLARQAI